jgi:zinc protease
MSSFGRTFVTVLTLAFAGGALAPAPAYAQERPEFKLNLPPYGLAMWSYVYPSGLRVLIQQDESAPVTAISTVVDHGAVSDPVGKEGTAMLTEYLWFQSRHGDSARVQDRLYAAGATYHADTKADFTYFFTVAPQESTFELMALEGQRLSDPLAGVTPELLTAARELVRNDFRFGGADLADTALPYLYGRLFPEGNPYHRIGQADTSLDGISVADLQAWTKEHYKPEATTIMVVTALDPEKVKDALYWSFEPTLFDPKLTKDLVKRYISSDYEGDEKDLDESNPAHWSMRPFNPEAPSEQLPTDGVLPSHISTDGTPPAPPEAAVRDMDYIKAPVAQRTAVLAWSIPAAFRGNDYLYQVVAGVVENSFLVYYRENPGVEKDDNGEPLADCKARGMAESSVLVCTFVLQKNSVPESIADRAIDQVSLLWNPDMKAALDKTFYTGRNKAMSDLLIRLDDFMDPENGRLATGAKNTHFSGNANVQAETMSSIMGTESQDVSAFALDWLDRKRAVRILLEPMAAEERLGELGRGGGYAGDMLEGRVAAAGAPPSADAVKAAFHGPNLDKLSEKTLSNGLRVVVMKHGEAPLVLASVVVGGGRNSGDVGIDDAMNGMLYESPHPAATEDMNETQLINIAGKWTKDRTSTHTWNAIKASAGNVDAVLYSLRRQIDLRNPATEFKAGYVKDERDELKALWGNPAFWADAAQWEAMAPGYALGRVQTWQGLDTIAASSSATITAYLNRKFQPANATLVVVGDVEAEAVFADAEKYLGSWKPAAGVETGPFGALAPPSPPAGPKTYLLDVATPYATIDVSCQLTPWTTTTYADSTLLAQVLDDRFDKQLLDSGVLVLQSQVNAQLYPSGLGLLQFYVVVDGGAAGKALDAIEALGAEAAAGTFDAGAIGTYRMREAQTFGLRFQNLEAMRDTLISALASPDRDFAWFGHLRDGLADADAAALKAAFGSCNANFAATVRGTASVVGPQLDAAGWSYETIDWKAKQAELLQTHDPKAWKKLQKGK